MTNLTNLTKIDGFLQILRRVSDIFEDVHAVKVLMTTRDS